MAGQFCPSVHKAKFEQQTDKLFFNFEEKTDGKAGTGLISGAGFDFLVQPYPRPGPVILGRGLRDAKDLGGFGDGHTHEVAQFDQFSLDVVVDGELVESVMHRQKLILIIRPGKLGGLQIQSLVIPTVAHGALVAGLFNQDAAHCLRGGGKEMGPSFPVVALAADQAQPGLVNQRRGLERLAGGLVGQFSRRQLPKFFVNQREQFVRGLGVALLCGFEDLDGVAYNSNYATGSVKNELIVHASSGGRR